MPGEPVDDGYIANTCLLCGHGVPFQLGLCRVEDREAFRELHWRQFHPDVPMPPAPARSDPLT